MFHNRSEASNVGGRDGSLNDVASLHLHYIWDVSNILVFWVNTVAILDAIRLVNYTRWGSFRFWFFTTSFTKVSNNLRWGNFCKISLLPSGLYPVPCGTTPIWLVVVHYLIFLRFFWENNGINGFLVSENMWHIIHVCIISTCKDMRKNVLYESYSNHLGFLQNNTCYTVI